LNDKLFSNVLDNLNGTPLEIKSWKLIQ